MIVLVKMPRGGEKKKKKRVWFYIHPSNSALWLKVRVNRLTVCCRA